MEYTGGRRHNPIISIYLRLGEALMNLTFPDAPKGKAGLDPLHVCPNAFFGESSSPQILSANSGFSRSRKLARQHSWSFRQLPEGRKSHSPSRLIGVIIGMRSFVEATHRQKFVFHTTT